MTDFKGTKEKWIVDGETFIAVESKKYAIARVFTTYSESIISEEAKANALLISKAPELLEVLKGLVSDVGNLLSEHDIEWQQAGYYETAKELIKEATNI